MKSLIHLWNREKLGIYKRIKAISIYQLIVDITYKDSTM